MMQARDMAKMLDECAADLRGVEVRLDRIRKALAYVNEEPMRVTLNSRSPYEPDGLGPHGWGKTR